MYKRIGLQFTGNQQQASQQMQQPKAPQQPAQQAAPNSGVDSGKKQSASGPGRHGLGYRLGIPIAVIILATIFYYAYTLSGSANPNTGNPLYKILIHKPLNLTQLAVLGIDKFSNTSTLNVSYAGSAIVNSSGSGSLLGGMTLNIPFTLNILKYYDNLRFTLHASDIPLMGNVSIVGIMLSNGTFYTCTTSFGFSHIVGASGSNHTCSATHMNQSLTALLDSAAKNLSSGGLASILAQRGQNLGGSLKTNISTTFVNVSSFNGQTCYLVNGVVAVSGNTSSYSPEGSSSTAGNVDYSECLSPQYYIPLKTRISANFSTVYASSNTAMLLTLDMHETGISSSVTSAEVSVLPGPVTNSSLPLGTVQINATGPSVTENLTINATAQAINATLPSVGGTMNVASLDALINNGFNAQPFLNVNYSIVTKITEGSVTSYINGSEGSATSYIIGSLTAAKYYANVSQREEEVFKVSQMEAFNGYNITSSDISLSGSGGIKNYFCTTSSCFAEASSAISPFSDFMSERGLNSSIVTAVVRNIGPSSVNGNACTLLQGTGTTHQIESFMFTLCLSPAYIPLNFTALSSGMFNGTSVSATYTTVAASLSTAPQRITLPEPLNSSRVLP